MTLWTLRRGTTGLRPFPRGRDLPMMSHWHRPQDVV